jgi:peptidoglycan/xylan/chitin deacetylase (PgdA/CDA1 family)
MELPSNLDSAVNENAVRCYQAEDELLVWLSHDVDRVAKGKMHALYYCAKERHPRHLQQLFSRQNPYWNFDRITKLEGKYGARSTFFFLHETLRASPLAPKTYILAKGRYSFDEARVQSVIKSLDESGWEVGLHGSYRSFCNKRLLKDEKRRLEDILAKPVDSIRQHYWNNQIPLTWEIQSELGFRVDATLVKKNDVGFPEGCMQPFRPFGNEFVVIPTCLMDSYLFEKAGGEEKAREYVDELIDLCKAKRAVLSVLWHQRLINAEEFPGYYRIYEYILAACTRNKARFVLTSDIV